MNTAYVYLQIYKLFDDLTPVPADCGGLCDKACCKGTDCGMYLFPGEKKVYELLSPDWISIEDSDFKYTHSGKNYTVPIAMCDGECDRFQRPLACRIFPVTPILDENGKLELITDPRAKSICPMAKNFHASEYNNRFLKACEKSFKLLMKNAQFASFMKEYTKYLNEYRKFF